MSPDGVQRLLRQPDVNGIRGAWSGHCLVTVPPPGLARRGGAAAAGTTGKKALLSGLARHGADAIQAQLTDAQGLKVIRWPR